MKNATHAPAIALPPSGPAHSTHRRSYTASCPGGTTRAYKPRSVGERKMEREREREREREMSEVLQEYYATVPR